MINSSSITNNKLHLMIIILIQVEVIIPLQIPIIITIILFLDSLSMMNRIMTIPQQSIEYQRIIQLITYKKYR